MANKSFDKHIYPIYAETNRFILRVKISLRYSQMANIKNDIISLYKVNLRLAFNT